MLESATGLESETTKKSREIHIRTKPYLEIIFNGKNNFLFESEHRFKIFINSPLYQITMVQDTLSDNLRIFYDEMDVRLKDLPPEQQQQYLEGLVHAFDSITRYANPRELTPFEREEFIGSAKSWAYSKAHHLNLDPRSEMERLIESDSEGVAISYAFAAQVQEALGIPLDFEQAMILEQVRMVYQFQKTEQKNTIKIR